jgi:hypothetical protein
MTSLVKALRASSSALAVFTGAPGSGRTPVRALPSPGAFIAIPTLPRAVEPPLLVT